MFHDQSKRARKKPLRFKAAAILTAVLTCIIVPLFYLVSRPGYSEQQPTGLTRADLLVAMTATTQRMLLPEATRAWRKGVPTVIVMETGYDLRNTSKAFQAGINKHQEKFADFPDVYNRPKFGDMRATITPFLANKTAGIDSYKWMLFGDDDTVFYVDNALRLLETLDHTMPYILSDHIWFPTDLKDFDMGQYLHPNRIAPRCLPCNYTDPAEGLPPANKTYIGFRAPRACPCTPKDVCASDNLGLFSDGNCDPARFHWFWPHGGAGMIFSQGLMRMREYDEIEKAVKDMDWGRIGAGDFAIAHLIWKEFGIMATDPGYGYFRPTITLFDPGWRLTPDGHDLGTHPGGVMDRFEMALQGWCNEECEDQLQHLISIHLGARESAWHQKDIRKALKHHPSQAAADDEDLGHMHMGLYLHTRLAFLFQQYAAARRLSRIKWMSHVYDTSDPPVP